jgi:hypothetical protein
MICDRSFAEDGSFRYPSLDPNLRDRRILNASNARRYRLALDPPPRWGPAFVQIGNDVGLLAEPINHDRIEIAQAERFDVVVDFSSYPIGTQVTLTNQLGDGPTGQVMRFHVIRRAKDDTAVPARLVEVQQLTRSAATVTRSFVFDRRRAGWAIIGKTFDPDRDDAQPRLGATEIWRLDTDAHHPVHLHLAHFQVLSRRGRGPGRYDAGWKDTTTFAVKPRSWPDSPATARPLRLSLPQPRTRGHGHDGKPPGRLGIRPGVARERPAGGSPPSPDPGCPRSGRRVDLLDELGEPVLVEVAGQISLADNADEAMVLDDRQPLDPVVLHLMQHLTDVGGGVDPEQRVLGKVTRPDLGRVAAFGDALYRDVPVGEDAVQPIVPAADRKRADSEIAHPLRGGRDVIVLADALGSRVHDVSRVSSRLQVTERLPLGKRLCLGLGLGSGVSVKGG